MGEGALKSHHGDLLRSNHLLRAFLYQLISLLAWLLLSLLSTGCAGTDVDPNQKAASNIVSDAGTQKYLELNLNTSWLADAWVDQYYSQQLNVSGGLNAGYHFEAISELPAGLILSESGLLFGTPTIAIPKGKKIRLKISDGPNVIPLEAEIIVRIKLKRWFIMTSETSALTHTQPLFFDLTQPKPSYQTLSLPTQYAIVEEFFFSPAGSMVFLKSCEIISTGSCARFIIPLDEDELVAHKIPEDPRDPWGTDISWSSDDHYLLISKMGQAHIIDTSRIPGHDESWVFSLLQSPLEPEQIENPKIGWIDNSIAFWESTSSTHYVKRQLLGWSEVKTVPHGYRIIQDNPWGKKALIDQPYFLDFSDADPVLSTALPSDCKRENLSPDLRHCFIATENKIGIYDWISDSYHFFDFVGRGNAEAHEFAFSPDGKQLLFTATFSDPEFSANKYLFFQNTEDISLAPIELKSSAFNMSFPAFKWSANRNRFIVELYAALQHERYYLGCYSDEEGQPHCEEQSVVFDGVSTLSRGGSRVISRSEFDMDFIHFQKAPLLSTKVRRKQENFDIKLGWLDFSFDEKRLIIEGDQGIIKICDDIDVETGMTCISLIPVPFSCLQETPYYNCFTSRLMAVQP